MIKAEPNAMAGGKVICAARVCAFSCLGADVQGQDVLVWHENRAARVRRRRRLKPPKRRRSDGSLIATQDLSLPATLVQATWLRRQHFLVLTAAAVEEGTTSRSQKR